MLISHLRADKPIVKRYTLSPDGKLQKDNYPFVYEVTSETEDVTTIQQLFELICRHAGSGHCLLKGQLRRPLIQESRAGTTDPDTPTEWVCLDLDGVEGFQTVDLFLEAIGCAATDYILQWSSSMGIENKAGFRCHVFMLLDRPAYPQVLKHWLTDLNLKILKTQLTLTKTSNALRWPLDITTCQNDKLIYTAPPILGPGIPDPLSKARITLVERSNRFLVLPYQVPSKDVLRATADALVNELRASSGFPKRPKSVFKFAGQVEYLARPDQALITGRRTERGFVYFNLNGGDSWAYYHPENNPMFIYNFKGEPPYRTEDLLPEYWAEIRSKHQKFEPDHQGMIYLAFRDLPSSNYYNGFYNPENQEIKLYSAKNTQQLKDFLKQHGQVVGDFVQDWEIMYSPTDDFVIDLDRRLINQFQPSEFLKKPPGPAPAALPPIAHRIIWSALGSNQETYDHFLNWLACILQFRDRTQTAWVLHGTEGTGKGLVFHKIITPLLGVQNVANRRFEQLESEFTDFMQNKLVTFIDEIEVGKSLYHSKIDSKLRNLIVEPTVSVRVMYRPAFDSKNFNNLIFASNKPAPVVIPPDDRRYNVGQYQTQKLQITPRELDIQLLAELDDVYAYLMTYPADREKARLPLNNSAKQHVVMINRQSLDIAVDALMSGDLEFFWDQLPAKKSQALGGMEQTMMAARYRDLIIELVQQNPDTLSRDELWTLFEYTVGSMPSTPNKFTSVLRHHNITMSSVWRHKRVVRGIKTEWKTDPIWLAAAQQEISSNLV